MSLQLCCGRCFNPIKTMAVPCPNCGYEHALTEEGKQRIKTLYNSLHSTDKESQK